MLSKTVSACKEFVLLWGAGTLLQLHDLGVSDCVWALLSCSCPILGEKLRSCCLQAFGEGNVGVEAAALWWQRGSCTSTGQPRRAGYIKHAWMHFQAYGQNLNSKSCCFSGVSPVLLKKCLIPVSRTGCCQREEEKSLALRGMEETARS